MAWQIDSSHSSIEFSVRHMMLSKVRGRFQEFEGTVQIDQENPSRSYAEGTVQVASVDTGSADRDNHLRTADFFEPDTYPTMHFRVTGIEPRAEGEYEVSGELTIKDTTRTVVWEVEDEGQGIDPWGNQRWGLSAETKIDRKEFGLTWNVALEKGGFLVGDKVEIEVNLQLVQTQEETEAEAVPA